MPLPGLTIGEEAAQQSRLPEPAKDRFDHQPTNPKTTGHPQSHVRCAPPRARWPRRAGRGGSTTGEDDQDEVGASATRGNAARTAAGAKGAPPGIIWRWRRAPPRNLASGRHLLSVLEQIPVYITACLHGRPSGDNAVLTGFYGSVYPAVWSLQLALRSRGLGSTIVGYHLAEHEPDVARILGIPDDVTQVAMLARRRRPCLIDCTAYGINSALVGIRRLHARRSSVGHSGRTVAGLADRASTASPAVAGRQGRRVSTTDRGGTQAGRNSGMADGRLIRCRDPGRSTRQPHRPRRAGSLLRSSTRQCGCRSTADHRGAASRRNCRYPDGQ